MHDPEKSDSGIVATKPTNKGGRPAAEPAEPRPGTKGNADQQSTHRTQSRVRVTQALDRVREAARRRKKGQFTALLHHIDADTLRTAFYALKREAAPAVDGMTWHDYEADLSSDAKCNTPRRFDIGKVVQDLRSVAMRSYSHLSEDERDQIGVLRAAGRSMGAIARALGRAKATISRELQRNALPLGGYSPLYVCSWGTGSPRDGRPNRSPVG